MKFPRYVGYYVARECSETYLWLCKGTWTEGRCLYEHRQGKGLISSVPLVYEFRKSNRFTDERLIRLLAAMRTPGGQLLQNDAWEALKVQRPIRLCRPPRASESGSMQTDPRVAKQLLWYIVAIDLPGGDRPTSVFRAMTIIGHLTIASDRVVP